MAEEKKGFFKRSGKRTYQNAKTISLPDLIPFSAGFPVIDDDFTNELEEILIMGDIGINATTSILEHLKEQVAEQHIKEPSQCKHF